MTVSRRLHRYILPRPRPHKTMIPVPETILPLICSDILPSPLNTHSPSSYRLPTLIPFLVFLREHRSILRGFHEHMNFTPSPLVPDSASVYPFARIATQTPWWIYF